MTTELETVPGLTMLPAEARRVMQTQMWDYEYNDKRFLADGHSLKTSETGVLGDPSTYKIVRALDALKFDPTLCNCSADENGRLSFYFEGREIIEKLVSIGANFPEMQQFKHGVTRA